MNADSEKKPEEPARSEEQKRPYEPPKVESVRLSRDAAESLT
jgi:hypothetical protein